MEFVFAKLSGGRENSAHIENNGSEGAIKLIQYETMMSMVQTFESNTLDKKKGIKDRRITRSGAVGGPGTSAGLNFQVDFAILHALEAISQLFADPLEARQISMEPRVVTGDGNVTCWDVRLSHPERVVEVKLKPKRVEIMEWLGRVEIGMQEDANCRFELFYGRGASPILSAIESLCRIAKEADGNVGRFENLFDLELSPDIEAVMGHLKAKPHVSLLRVRVTPIDQQSLEREIQFSIRHLVCEPDRTRLYDFLFTKFHKGIEQRATYHVRELIKEAHEAQIELFAPPAVLPRHRSPVVSSAIYILQHCETGLPAEVLAAGIDCTIQEIEDSLSEHVGAGGLTSDEGCWAAHPIRPLIAHHDTDLRLIGKALSQLLEFIGANKKSTLGWCQVPNAIALAKVCQSEDSELVSALFWKLDKLLKRTGNKRLVLEVANISLKAARRLPRTEAKSKGKAVALICGRSWVFQRTNRLPEARAAGEKSLKLGKDIGWCRNTAFCLKCLGRLFRMEAELHRQDEEEFKKLLDLSIDHLERAISTFPQATELSEADRDAEVGDCQSLLSRSYCVAGDLVQADASAREAIDRLTDDTSKDYADLQILLGDLTYAKNGIDAAVRFYDEAIRAAGTSDAEKSEISARAYLQKGRVTKSRSGLDRAAEIWTKLEEDELADDARWRSMQLAGRVPSAAEQVLKDEDPSVRVETIRLHETRLEGLAKSLGRRSEPGRDYWKELLPQARKNMAIRHVEW